MKSYAHEQDFQSLLSDLLISSCIKYCVCDAISDKIFLGLDDTLVDTIHNKERYFTHT